jgi:hypothetical protein
VIVPNERVRQEVRGLGDKIKRWLQVRPSCAVRAAFRRGLATMWRAKTYSAAKPEERVFGCADCPTHLWCSF